MLKANIKVSPTQEEEEEEEGVSIEI